MRLVRCLILSWSLSVVLPACAEYHEPYKDIPTKFMLPDRVPYRDPNFGKITTPPKDLFVLWRETVTYAVYNRFKNQPEYAQFKGKKLQCQIDFIVYKNGTISDVQIRKHSLDMTFDALIEKCLKSLQKERVLNFPYTLNEKRYRMILDFCYPIQNVSLPDDHARFLYFNSKGKVESGQRNIITAPGGAVIELKPDKPDNTGEE